MNYTKVHDITTFKTYKLCNVNEEQINRLKEQVQFYHGISLAGENEEVFVHVDADKEEALLQVFNQFNIVPQ